VPLSVGVSYLFKYKNWTPYVGIGPILAYSYIHNGSKHVTRHQNGWGGGFLTKLGFLTYVAENVFLPIDIHQPSCASAQNNSPSTLYYNVFDPDRAGGSAGNWNLKCGSGGWYLSAYELAAIDLLGTEIVTLSACESGLGETVDGEGVHGLRRAFRLAGARTIISSLWQIPDETTADFMKHLYSRHDEPIPQSIRRAQLRHIEKLRASGRPDHPFDWAAFISVGGW
jgi:hypothetical protein